MRRVSLLAFFLIGFISLSGCSTVHHTVNGFSEGLAKDAKAVWKSMVKADEWFDKNTW